MRVGVIEVSAGSGQENSIFQLSFLMLETCTFLQVCVHVSYCNLGSIRGLWSSDIGSVVVIGRECMLTAQWYCKQFLNLSLSLSPTYPFDAEEIGMEAKRSRIRTSAS